MAILDNLGSLFRTQRASLMRLLRRRGAPSALVEDLAQEAFLRVLQAHAAGGIADPRAYLFRTAENLATDQARRQRVAPFVALPATAQEAIADPAPSQEQILFSRQELLALVAALRSLSPRARTVLLLVRFEGMTYREVGQRLGIAPTTAHGYMVEGLLRLADRMRDWDRGA